MLIICAHQSRMWNNGLPRLYGIDCIIYTAVRCTLFILCKPGTYSRNSGPSPTVAFIIELSCTHTKNMRISRKHKQVDMVCKKVITSLVSKVYYRILKRQYIGYAQIVPRNIDPPLDGV